VVSNYRGRPIDAKTLLFGEVGLGGEIRAVSRPQARLREGAKLGFQRCIVPQRCCEEIEPDGLEVVGVTSVDDLIEILFV
jgi:DNA repair protein RadA/Sms